MPKELIFTSVPIGLKPGSSGYCTVARHHNLDASLERELERLSFYEMDTDLMPVIHTYRLLSLSSGNFYVLSRICYAGNDHTGRTNYLAHHLVFEEIELAAIPTLSPVDFFLDPIGWVNEWPKGKEPIMYNDGEGEKSPFCNPSKFLTNEKWLSVTGNQKNVYEPLYRTKWGFICEDGSHELSLFLIQELCSLPEVNTQQAWSSFSFTTFLQKSDNPSDFYFACGPSSGALAALKLNFLHLGKSAENCFQAISSNTLGPLVPQHKETSIEHKVAKEGLTTTRQTQEASQVTPTQSENFDVVDYPARSYGQTVASEFSSNIDDLKVPDQDKSPKKLIISAVVVVLFILLGGTSFLILKFNQVEEFEDTLVENSEIETVQSPKAMAEPISIENNEESPPAEIIPTKKVIETEEPKVEIETPPSPSPVYPEEWTLDQKEEYNESLTEIRLVSSFDLEEIKGSEVYAWAKNNRRFEWQDALSDTVDEQTILASRREVMKKGGFEIEKVLVEIKQSEPRMLVQASSFPAGLLFDRKLKLSSSTYQEVLESMESVSNFEFLHDKLPSGLRDLINHNLNESIKAGHFDWDKEETERYNSEPEFLRMIFKDLKKQKEILAKVDLNRYNYKKIKDNIIKLIKVDPVLECLIKQFERLKKNKEQDEKKKEELNDKNEKIHDVRDEIIKIFDLDWDKDSNAWNDGKEFTRNIVSYLKKKGLDINPYFIEFEKDSKQLKRPENDQIGLSDNKEEELKEEYKKDEREKFNEEKGKEKGKEKQEKFDEDKAEEKWEELKDDKFERYIEKEFKSLMEKLKKYNAIKDLEFAFEKETNARKDYSYLPALEEIVKKMKSLHDAANQFHTSNEPWKIVSGGATIIKIFPN